MRLFIDCEWNGYKGELMSMALVSENDDAWYCVMPSPTNPIDPWVQENVVPNLLRFNPRLPHSFFSAADSLANFLSQWSDEGVHIVADWPEDIARFCDLLIVGPGKRMDTPPLTMEIVRVNGVSKKPHHALYDAEALRDAVLKGEER